MVMIFG